MDSMYRRSASVTEATVASLDIASRSGRRGSNTQLRNSFSSARFKFSAPLYCRSHWLSQRFHPLIPSART